MNTCRILCAGLLVDQKRSSAIAEGWYDGTARCVIWDLVNCCTSCTTVWKKS